MTNLESKDAGGESLEEGNEAAQEDVQVSDRLLGNAVVPLLHAQVNQVRSKHFLLFIETLPQALLLTGFYIIFGKFEPYNCFYLYVIFEIFGKN